MDDTKLQLQIRCAAAEEKAEGLQRELRVIIEKDSEGKIASLQQEFGELRKANRILDGKLLEVNSDHDRMRRAARMDESVMVGLKKKLKTAKNELESLKRKRADSISPERVITGNRIILGIPDVIRTGVMLYNRAQKIKSHTQYDN